MFERKTEYRGKFYIYKRFDEKTKSIIKDSKIFYSNISMFNDPFEGKIKLIKPNSNTEIENYMKPTVDKKLNNRKEKREFMKKIKKKGLKDEFINEVQGKIQSFFKSNAILCLSETRDNILMYSHYADSHKGICLEFTILEEDKLYEAEKINYQSTLPAVHAFKSDGDIDKLVEQVYFTKAKEWEYEKEWRHVLTDEESGLKEFRPECLTGIIFGCRSSQETIAWVSQEIKNKGHKIELYQAILKEDEFGLHVVSY